MIDSAEHVEDRASTSEAAPSTKFLETMFRKDRPVEVLNGYGSLAARLLMSQIFLISGFMKIFDPSGTAAEMEGRGMFWIPLFLIGAIACEIGGGFSLLLGYKARFGALVLLLFLVPVTLTFHNFWTYPPDQQRMQSFMFMHNWALMGGLLLITTFGPGRLSIDRRRRNDERHPNR